VAGRTILTPQGQRIEPRLPAHLVKTYRLVQPVSSHYRQAACREVECEAWRLGWVTTVNEATELGQRQAYYIRMHSGRKYRQRGMAGGFTEFWFGPGQQCFATHQVPLEREPLYVVQGGDWRGNPRREGRRHTRAEFWVEDFATHQDKLGTKFQEG
jgi:hypothetical protein